MGSKGNGSDNHWVAFAGKTVKPLERYHYMGPSTKRLLFVDLKVFRISIWRNWTRYGESCWFTSVWLFNHLQAYYGKAKLDGTMTYLHGVFDYEGKMVQAIYTDEPKEQKAFRWRRLGPGVSHWNDQGGS